MPNKFDPKAEADKLRIKKEYFDDEIQQAQSRMVQTSQNSQDLKKKQLSLSNIFINRDESIPGKLDQAQASLNRDAKDIHAMQDYRKRTAYDEEQYRNMANRRLAGTVADAMTKAKKK